jgi:hypothetical protein
MVFDRIRQQAGGKAESVTLQQRDVYRLSPSDQAVRVVSGRAWLTHAGEDIVLTRGEQATFPRQTDSVVITAVGKRPLVLEIATK